MICHTILPQPRRLFPHSDKIYITWTKLYVRIRTERSPLEILSCRVSACAFICSDLLTSALDFGPLRRENGPLNVVEFSSEEAHRFLLILVLRSLVLCSMLSSRGGAENCKELPEWRLKFV